VALITDVVGITVSVGSDVAGFLRGVGTATQSVSALQGRASNIVLGGLTGAGLAGGAGFALKLAADAEKAQIAFELLTGSAEKAQQVLSEIRGLRTPIPTGELIVAAREMAAMDIATDKLVPTLRALSDVSAGSGKSVAELASVFARAHELGQVTSYDLRALMRGNIPVIDAMAQELGVTKGQIRQMAGEGRISFNDLAGAFERMTGPGGRFFDMTRRQSETLGGSFQMLEKAGSQALMTLGESAARGLNLAGAARSVTDWAAGLKDQAAQIEPVFAALREPIAAVGSVAMPLLEALAVGLGGILDLMTNVGGAVERYLVAPILDALRSVADAFAKIFASGAKLPGVGDTFGGAAGEMRAVAAWAREWRDTMKEAGKVSMDEGLNFEWAARGQALFDGLRGKAQGAAQAVKGVGDAAGGLKDMADVPTQHMQDRARELAKELRTPLEAFGDTMNELNTLFEKNLVTWEIFSAGTLKAIDQLEKATGPEVAQNAPHALMAGSQEAATALASFQNRTAGGDDVGNKIERAVDAGRRASERTAKASEDLFRYAQANHIILGQIP
jgi:tape measure domain-containing protein